MKTKVLLVLLAVFAAAGGAYFYMNKTNAGEAQAAQAESAQMPPMPVNVVRVQKQNIEIADELSGRTSAYKVAEIRPQVSGIIKKRLFVEGSKVQEGDQLYQIDDATYKTALESAKAQLLQAQAALLATKPKAERYEELVKAGGISRQAYDDAVSALKQAEASVAGAKAAVRAAQINLDYTKVVSPITGRIGKSSVTEGALVTANQAAALAKVQTLEKIYVDVQQSGAQVRKLRKTFEADAEKTVRLYVEGDSESYPYEGVFQFADVSVDVTTGMVELRILFPNPDMELLPGMFVKARIGQDKLSDVLLVPQRSVMRTAGGDAYVWTVNAEGKVEMKTVEAVRTLGSNWIVSSGLNDGDLVMINGFQKTGPGATVTPVETEIED